MDIKSITNNRFNPKTTKRVIIHDGRFHADDVLASALILVCASKFKNEVEIIRTSTIPSDFDPNTIAVDVGFGVYDHHTDINGVPSVGLANSKEESTPAACSLLYEDIKDILFPGNSETKMVFSAFIDIVAHCDNTPDLSTFGDSINYLTPIDESEMDEAANKAIMYCRAVVQGFVEAHEKEKSGKIWAVPKVCGGIVPGTPEKKDSRYWKASNQIKNKYKYISFNNTTDMKLRAMDTYSLACGVLNQNRRQYWRTEVEKSDAAQIKEIDRRLAEEWPKALSEIKYRTLVLDNYIPYNQFAKDLTALFVILPSQRGGYTVNILKTLNGKYRFNPDLLVNFDGCTFVANDKRFLTFDTKEHAIEAAHIAGETVNRYIEKYGYFAYRDVYGGCAKEPISDFYQALISEDIALNMFVRENVKNASNISIEELHKIQSAVYHNHYATHSMCTRLIFDEGILKWDFDKNIAEDKSLSFVTLSKQFSNGKRWDFGLTDFLNTPYGDQIWNLIHPPQR